MAELKLIVSRWNHERDRAVLIRRDAGGRTYEEVIYDSGCCKCRRCEVEKWIRKQEAA